jgi:hypothetical protein
MSFHRIPEDLSLPPDLVAVAPPEGQPFLKLQAPAASESPPAWPGGAANTVGAPEREAAL